MDFGDVSTADLQFILDLIAIDHLDAFARTLAAGSGFLGRVRGWRLGRGGSGGLQALSSSRLWQSGAVEEPQGSAPIIREREATSAVKLLQILEQIVFQASDTRDPEPQLARLAQTNAAKTRTGMRHGLW